MRCETCDGVGEVATDYKGRVFGAGTDEFRESTEVKRVIAEYQQTTTWGTVQRQLFERALNAMPLVPCPTCGGCGIASCCDGMVEL